MVDDYVFGFSLRELQDDSKRLQEGGGDQGTDAMAAYIEKQLATGNFPHLARIVGREGARATIDRVAELGGDDRRFERGIKRLLDGIALNLP